MSYDPRIVVPNLAALTALSVASLANGTVAWVQTLRTEFSIDISTTPTDGITIVPSSEVGRQWFRALVPDASWASLHDWFVDLQDVSGHASDENSGADAAHPLATNAEFFRRWRGQVIGVAGGVNYTVNYLSGSAAASEGQNDPLEFDLYVKSTNALQVVITVNGPPTIVLHTGVLTGAVPINPATNQDEQITDAALAAGAWGAWVNKRIRLADPAAPARAAIGWVAKDLGGTSARVSSICSTTSGPFGTTELVPIAGDTYVIEDLGFVCVGVVNLRSTGSDPTGAILQLVNLDTGDLNDGATVLTSDVGMTILFAWCKVQNSIQTDAGGDLEFNNCLDAFVLKENGPLQIFAGLSTSTLEAKNGGRLIVDVNHLAQGNTVIATYEGILQISGDGIGGGGLSVFDAAGAPGVQLLNSSIVVLQGLLWGAANGVGLQVGPGCTAIKDAANGGPTPNITGTSGDFQLGASTTDTRAWNPGANAYTAPIAPTWANFNAALPGGFAGNGHDLTSNAHLLTE